MKLSHDTKDNIAAAVLMVVLMAIGGVSVYSLIDGKTYSPCWATLTDVYWEALAQDALPEGERWKSNDGSAMFDGQCVPVEKGRPRELKRITYDEYMEQLADERKSNAN